jgi:hypothetical protein
LALTVTQAQWGDIISVVSIKVFIALRRFFSCITTENHNVFGCQIL